MFRVADEAGRRMLAKAGHRKRRINKCSGFTHTPIYYTILYQKTTARTRPLGGVWSCLAFLLNLLSSSLASAGLNLHGTLFHAESDQTQFLEPNHQASA